MKNIKLKSLKIANFKGIKKNEFSFSDNTLIKGQNASGKTSLLDAWSWLLFNKDSLGNTKFGVRPVDADGNMINDLEISVEATISVDSEEYTLKRIQKQKWTKKRGADTKEFSGNVNEYEINGYPKSEKEYKSFIAGIIDENVFSLITNPMAFTSLAWKDQRDTLMGFVGDFSDVEIAEKYGDGFSLLIPELKVAGTTDIQKKYQKQKTALNKDMTEIPARIDEVSKQLVLVDVDALKVEKEAKKAEIKKLEDSSIADDKLSEIENKRVLVMDLKFKANEIQNKENQKLAESNMKYREAFITLDQETKKIELELFDCKTNGNNCFVDMNRLKKETASMLEKLNKLKEEKYPDFVAPKPLTDKDMICPTCGQELSEEVKLKRIAKHKEISDRKRAEYDEAKKIWDDTRAEALAGLKSNIEENQKKLGTLETEFDTYKNRISELETIKAKNQKSYAEARQKVESLKTVVDVSEMPEWKSVQKEIEILEHEIALLQNDMANVSVEQEKIDTLQREIKEIELKILSADNSKVESRIAELEAEKKSVGQKLADTERMLDLVDEFTRTKMNLISDVINQKFNIVNWKLFETQINGGVKECCEATVNGVSFSNLNNGHRILAGLDIIKSLSELYEVSAPVWIDNAEALSENNKPEMDSQVIMLEVADNKELVVEI